MALYKHSRYLKTSESEAFDRLHQPGAITPNSGIYRCENCTDEIASNKDNPLPPQNHRQHAQNRGPIRWRLIVFSQQAK